ncbi:unnamed protein product [Absidia cylindrospora]
MVAATNTKTTDSERLLHAASLDNSGNTEQAISAYKAILDENLQMTKCSVNKKLPFCSWEIFIASSTYLKI